MDGYGCGQFTFSGEEEEREFLDLYAEELEWGNGFSAKASVRFFLLERMTHPVSAYFFDLDTTFMDPHIYFGPAVKKAQVGIIQATLRRFYPKSTPEDHFTAFVADTSYYDETLATVSGVRGGGGQASGGEESGVVAVYVLKPTAGLKSKLKRGAWIQHTSGGERYRLAEDAGDPTKGNEMLILWLAPPSSSSSTTPHVKPGEYRLWPSSDTFRVRLPSANVHVQSRGEIHRSSKMHVIFPNILVTAEQAMQIDFAIASVFQTVMSTLPEMDKGWSDACDYSVHSNSGSLRMVGSSKCGRLGKERVNLGRVYKLRWVIVLRNGRRTELRDHPALTSVYEMVRACSIRRPGKSQPAPEGWAPYPGCPRLALTETERSAAGQRPKKRKKKDAQGNAQTRIRQTPEEKQLSKRQRFTWKKDLPEPVITEITRIVRGFHPVYKRVRCYIEVNGPRTRYRVRLRGMGSNACLNLRSDSQDAVARLQRELLDAKAAGGEGVVRSLEERLKKARGKARPGFHKNQTAYFVIEADGAVQMCWCNCATSSHRIHGACGGGRDRQLDAKGRRYVFNPGFRSQKKALTPEQIAVLFPQLYDVRKYTMPDIDVLQDDGASASKGSGGPPCTKRMESNFFILGYKRNPSGAV
jgi:hypothetical protein